MYLKRLEIIGFKSFGEKTLLEFLPGITVIVGPNGCGKSNVLDAIRWALGEQSTRSLRASKMEDVIFNGTDRIHPLNMAEVSIVFDNQDRALDYDADEIVITRRLFRSGDSEYLLNKNQVRRRDIAELLMGTGIGAESYSIIEQGKISLLIGVKPEERRMVFDEAAGITKYKVKKKETLRKLQETEQNLLRIGDVIDEVRRQLNSLERQAKKARRYKELSDELKEKETIFGLRQWAGLEKEKEGLEEDLASIRLSITVAEEALEADNKQLEDLRKKIFALEEEITTIQDRLSSLNADYDQALAKISMNRDRISELKTQKELFSKERQELLGRLGERQARIEFLEKEAEEIREKIEKISAFIKSKEGELETFNVSLESKESQVESARKDLFEINRALVQERNHQQDLLVGLKEIESHILRLTRDEERINADIQEAEKRISSYRAQITRLNQEMTRIRESELLLAEEEIKRAREKSVILRQKLESLKSELAALEAQREILSHLEARYISLPQSMEIDVWVKRADFEIGSIVARVLGVIEENGDWIHVSCDAKILPKNLSDLEGRISSLRSDLENCQRQVEDADRAVDDAYANKRNIEARISSYQADIDNIEKMTQDYQGRLEDYNRELDLIKEDLDLVRRDAELKKHDLEASKEKVAKLETDTSSIQEKIISLESEIEDMRNKRLSLEQDLSKVRAERDILNANLANVLENLSTLKESLLQDKHVIEERAGLQSQIEESIERLEKEIQELEEKRERWQDEIEELRERRDLFREEYASLREAVEAIEGRRGASMEQLDDLRSKAYNLEIKIQEIGFKFGSICSHLAELYGVDIEEEKQRVILPIDVDLYSLEQEIGQLKDRIRRMGAVSTVAIEEYEELKQRYEFLTSQQEDLIKAKQTLKDTINKLNKTSEELFLDTFEKIKEEFKRFFRMLFGGGNSNISLMNPEDVLESGIEITARPPGKQLRNISLLSGGEKSLAAIALIFAIFKVKPSPFCILDEVDAALDESNVDRFIRLLKDFSKKSQFLVISHNKKTIASADVIYGVTMPASGISKVISVKLVEDTVPRRDVSAFINASH